MALEGPIFKPPLEVVVRDFCDEITSEAREKEKEKTAFVNEFWQETIMKKHIYDIYSAVQAFLELKADDIVIYRLLNKYYDIDSVTTADLFIKKAKIGMKLQDIAIYMAKQDSRSKDNPSIVIDEIYDSFEKLNYANLLEENSEWLDLSPERLLKKLNNN